MLKTKNVEPVLIPTVPTVKVTTLVVLNVLTEATNMVVNVSHLVHLPISLILQLILVTSVMKIV